MRKEVEMELSGVLQESFAFFDAESLCDHTAENKSDFSAAALAFNIDELPINELTEIVCQDSLNSIYALLPVISRLCEQDRWVTLISPPPNLDEKLFALYGIDMSRVLLIHPKGRDQDTTIMNETLKNGKSGIVIHWSGKVPNRFLAQWRKSVKQGGCIGVWVNQNSSPSFSTSVAVTASITATNKYVKIVNNLQFGVSTLASNETVLPKINLELLVTSRVRHYRHH